MPVEGLFSKIERHVVFLERRITAFIYEKVILLRRNAKNCIIKERDMQSIIHSCGSDQNH